MTVLLVVNPLCWHSQTSTTSVSGYPVQSNSTALFQSNKQTTSCCENLPRMNNLMGEQIAFGVSLYPPPPSKVHMVKCTFYPETTFFVHVACTTRCHSSFWCIPLKDSSAAHRPRRSIIACELGWFRGPPGGTRRPLWPTVYHAKMDSYFIVQQRDHGR